MEAAVNQLTTVETAKELGLLPEEFDQIKEILGRTPNFTELSIFSVMWSEHCSYKNSIKWLKTLPKEGKHMLVAAGEENAGLVDIGDGMACAFKIESHNHPSALEPYQGAATGVGGIHRDIFTMGARPIAALNSLRFGKIEGRMKYLIKGVVKGIGDYGNCFGVPTVGGEVYFEDCYQTNILVNAMSIGIAKVGETISATSHGIGNPVYIVGSSTGKDGIAGAAFASKDISADSMDDLPAVQVGDPFQEKLLLEATMELVNSGAIVGMQDMGAAGITCSTSEMSAKEGFGMKINLDKVPTRQADMKGWEILLSESQERMLVVVKAGQEEIVEGIFDKWDLHCEIIGEVTEGGQLEYFQNGEKIAELPAEPLVLGGGAPVNDREYEEPEYFAKLQEFSMDSIAEPKDYIALANALVQLPNIASKRWVYEQYDSMVGVKNASTNAPTDASVVRIPGSKKAIVASVDCNSRWVYADPFKGTAIAVSEAARNIVCSGGVPSGVTNCLNFGNPYNKGVYWQFVNAIKGMSAACEKFNTPVTGGNVSFYNQSADGGAVNPTPTIGMVGIMEDIENQMTLDFKNEGDLIYLIGTSRNDINQSEYLAHHLGVKESPCPYFDLEEEAALQNNIAALIKNKNILSAHDVSQGGLFVCLLESGFNRNLGFSIECDAEIRKDAFLFGEAQSRVVVSVSPEKESEFENFLQANNQEYQFLGNVTGGNVCVDYEEFGTAASYKESYNNTLEGMIVG